MDCSVTSVIFVYIVYRLIDWLIRKPLISELGDRYIFITGCDSGFGQAACLKLDSMGCHVFAGCLTEKGEDMLRKSCSEKVVPMRLDVTSHDSIVRAFYTVKEKLPSGKGLWGLINNAGIAGKAGPSEWLQKKDYEEVLNVNLHGLIDMTTVFLPLLKKEKGRIVNTASVFGRICADGSAPYSISKYGVECYSDSLRREMRVFGVTVHIIEPGFYKTNISDVNVLQDRMERFWQELPQHLKDEYGREYLDKTIDVVLKKLLTIILAEDITPVVDAYIHAVTSSFPRSRYVVGKDAKFLWVPLTWLPEWLSDFLLDKMTIGKPLPACLRK